MTQLAETAANDTGFVLASLYFDISKIV